MKRIGAALTIALSPVVFAAACVDGTTPDCSDAATQCGPNLDGSPERIEAALPEAATFDSATAAPDAVADGDAAAALDAGDEG
jgi:hypothetical protein